MKNALLLVTALAAAACAAQPLEEARGALLKNLRLTRFATRAGDRLVVDIPAGTNRSAHGSIPFDIARYDGRGVCATIRARGWRLTPTREKWLGFKFMMPFENAKTGTKVYPGAPQIVGDFGWRTLTVCDNDGRSSRTKGSLTLGIQEGTGKVEFDLSTLRIREVGPLWPVTNQNLRCAYTDRVRNLPVRRGVMLGHGLKEKDFADPETPVIIESNMYDSPSTFTYMMPMDLTNIIYQSHMYVPGDYTHQGVHDRKGPVVSYPNAKAGYDAAYLRRQLQPVRDFQLRHGARIYLGEFSAIVWAPGAGDYIRDCIALFEEYGWDWTFHAFREWNGWSVEHEATPETRTPVPSADNPRRRALLNGFRCGK